MESLRLKAKGTVISTLAEVIELFPRVCDLTIMKLLYTCTGTKHLSNDMVGDGS